MFGEPKSEAYIVLNRPLGHRLVNAAITEADQVLLACSSMFMNGLTENVQVRLHNSTFLHGSIWNNSAVLAQLIS